MSHYFIYDETKQSQKRTIEFTKFNQKFTFISDVGIFSKDKLDIGTSFFLDSIIKLNLGNSLLDVGCGVGIIGCVLKKMTQLAIIELIDINKRAIELAKENIINLKINDAIAYESDLFTNVKSTFDTILTNPPIRAGKDVIYKLYEEAVHYLNDEGKLLLVIRKSHGAESTITKLKTIYREVKVVTKKKGIYVIMAIK